MLPPMANCVAQGVPDVRRHFPRIFEGRALGGASRTCEGRCDASFRRCRVFGNANEVNMGKQLIIVELPPQS